MDGNSGAPRARQTTPRTLRRLLAGLGIGLAVSVTFAALVYWLAVPASAETYRIAVVLAEDNRERCEGIASDVLAAWESASSEPDFRIAGYYLGAGRVKLAAAARRTQQIREMLTKARETKSGELVVEFHASVVKLCDLAAAPAGYSRLKCHLGRFLLSIRPKRPAAWESASSEPDFRIAGYYLGAGRVKLAAAARRTQQIREMLTKARETKSGELGIEGSPPPRVTAHQTGAGFLHPVQHRSQPPAAPVSPDVR
jgi:hypothetical protein